MIIEILSQNRRKSLKWNSLPLIQTAVSRSGLIYRSPRVTIYSAGKKPFPFLEGGNCILFPAFCCLLLMMASKKMKRSLRPEWFRRQGVWYFAWVALGLLQMALELSVLTSSPGDTLRCDCLILIDSWWQSLKSESRSFSEDGEPRGKLLYSQSSGI